MLTINVDHSIWFVVISENLLPSFCMANPDVYYIKSDNFIGIHVFELFLLNIFNICVYMRVVKG